MKPVLFFLGMLLFSFMAKAQKDKIEGVWKGASFCQVKNSGCTDEMLVFSISKQDTKKYAIVMHKLVKGKETEMGTMIFLYDEGKRQLMSSQSSGEVWTLDVRDGKINGKVVYNKQLQRNIILKKST
jgi:hypothetical protein